MLIRELRFLIFLLMLFAAFAVVAASYESSGSETINLGSGPRPIYRIGYSGDGPVDIDELIGRAQSSLAESRISSDRDLGSLSSEPQKIEGSAGEGSTAIPTVASPSRDVPKKDVPKDEGRIDRPQPEADRIDEKKPPYVRVPVVSDPPGAEVYIDGIFYGITPFIATVVPDSHLVEAHLEGYWNWFNVVEFSDGSRTVPITLASRQPATVEQAESETFQGPQAPRGDEPSIGENGPANGTYKTPDDDFWEENYRKLLIVVAILSFLIGSGSIATWARSRLTNAVKISFPRDGEDRWGGLVEGQSSRIRGTKKQLYILVRCDDDQLQVARRVEPNRDGRWSTRCDVDEGTVYRIYALMVDRPLKEGEELEELPSHRAISEVGPVTGRARTVRPPDR